MTRHHRCLTDEVPDEVKNRCHTDPYDAAGYEGYPSYDVHQGDHPEGELIEGLVTVIRTGRICTVIIVNAVHPDVAGDEPNHQEATKNAIYRVIFARDVIFMFVMRSNTLD